MSGYQKSLKGATPILPCAVVMTLAVVLSACSERGGTAGPNRLPEQRQPDRRLNEIAAQDMLRQGNIVIQIIGIGNLDDGRGDSETLRYSFEASSSEVSDTEIRGMLDGHTKYSFNQATSYHMRVGRRIGGAYNGEFELKRSLIKWHLPAFPPSISVQNAAIDLWIEGFSTNAPVNREPKDFLPFHLYAYPLTYDWEPGFGGISKDSFSDAADGESSWTHARAGQQPWPAPGGLPHGYPPTLATALIDGDERWVRLSSNALREFVQTRIEDGNTVDILLKLDDQEEDRWGTETAVLSSNFGSDWDVEPKGPKLTIEANVPYTSSLAHHEFILEPGEELVFPAIETSGSEMVIDARIDAHDVTTKLVRPPSIYVRGGISPEAYVDQDWEPITNPIYRDWQSVEVKVVNAPQVISLGEEFCLTISEPWVSPGPREAQLPELVLVGPSGSVYHVDGAPVGGVDFAMFYLPDELGLWRYGWSYLPRAKSPPGSHQGEGLFFVTAPKGLAERQALIEYSEILIKELAETTVSSRRDQYRFNSFIRWAARYGAQGKEERQLSEDLIKKVRGILPSSFSNGL